MIYIIFPTNQATMNAADQLKNNNIYYTFTPIPQEVNHNCGFCISFEKTVLSQVLDTLDLTRQRDIHIFQKIDKNQYIRLYIEELI
jgi:hypothetical protein